MYDFVVAMLSYSFTNSNPTYSFTTSASWEREGLLLPGAALRMTIQLGSPSPLQEAEADAYEFGADGSLVLVDRGSRSTPTQSPHDSNEHKQNGVPAAVLRRLPTASMREAKGGECSICFSELKSSSEPVKLPCAHIYHKSCITRWLATHTGCPLCRRDVSCAASSTTSAPLQLERDRHTTDSAQRPRQRSSHGAAAAASPVRAPMERSHRQSLTSSRVAPRRGCEVSMPSNVRTGHLAMRRSDDMIVPQWRVSGGNAEERAAAPARDEPIIVSVAGERLERREPPRRRGGNGSRSMPAIVGAESRGGAGASRS